MKGLVPYCYWSFPNGSCFKSTGLTATGKEKGTRKKRPLLTFRVWWNNPFCLGGSCLSDITQKHLCDNIVKSKFLNTEETFLITSFITSFQHIIPGIVGWVCKKNRLLLHIFPFSHEIFYHDYSKFHAVLIFFNRKWLGETNFINEDVQ